jgi:hypothetical protein
MIGGPVFDRGLRSVDVVGVPRATTEDRADVRGRSWWFGCSVVVVLAVKVLGAAT